MPVRKIPCNTRSITGRVACYLRDKSLGYESFLEHDLILLMLFHPEVADMEEQPVRIEYPGFDSKGKARTRHYVPDFLVKFMPSYGCPPVLAEVKYESQLREEREELMPKIKAGQHYARERGWRYRVYTERHIRGIRLDNVKFLRPFLRFPRDHAGAERLLCDLRRSGRSTPAELLVAQPNASEAGQGRLIAALWRLLAAHEVRTDLDTTPLSMSSPLWLTKEPGPH